LPNPGPPFVCQGAETLHLSFPAVEPPVVAHLGPNHLSSLATEHLGQADIAASSLDTDIPVDSNETSDDCQAIVVSSHTSLQIFWDNAAVIDGFGVFSDFASFTRLSFADAAEFVAEKSNKAAEKLRGAIRGTRQRRYRETD
jgi:hypothetical protein